MSCPKRINAAHKKRLESGCYCSQGSAVQSLLTAQFHWRLGTQVDFNRRSVMQWEGKTKGPEIAGISGPDSKWSTPKTWTNTQTHSNQWLTPLQLKSPEASSTKLQYFSRSKKSAFQIISDSSSRKFTIFSQLRQLGQLSCEISPLRHDWKPWPTAKGRGLVHCPAPWKMGMTWGWCKCCWVNRSESQMSHKCTTFHIWNTRVSGQFSASRWFFFQHWKNTYESSPWNTSKVGI